MKKNLLLFCFVTVFGLVRAEFLLVPMDKAQANHIRAYGVAFQSLKAGNKVQWLLNYRGGAFLMQGSEANEALLKTAGVSYERLDDGSTEALITIVLSPTNSMNLVTMNHLPRIAVYTPPFSKPYDDAVTIALTYAGIDYTTIYDREVLTQDLHQYDWIHVHHEDFTGQFNKWQNAFPCASWFDEEQADARETSKEFNFSKVTQMKGAVAAKLRSFVEDGGQLFAMCAGTDKLDIALAAEGIDISPSEIDGDPADPDANAKLNYSGTFAFQNFTVDTSATSQQHSDIPVSITSKSPGDRFSLESIDAKKDLTAAILVQDHESSIKEFLGNTTAFHRAFIKPSVQILGGTATDAKYLHGQRGKGYFTYYAGHDPEAYKHMVGDKATDLDSFRQSAGYRLILNNIFFDAVSGRTLGVADETLITTKVFPDPFTNIVTVQVSSPEAKEGTIYIYNLSGQIMATDNFISDTGDFSKLYNVAGYAAGMYIIEIVNNKGTLSKTLVTKVQ